MNIDRLIRDIGADPDCEVRPPSGLPSVTGGHRLPADLSRFYELCGGVALFGEGPYGYEILEPGRVAEANIVIVGEQFEDDISQSWYTIAHDYNGDYLTIDLAPERIGRCYDSFHETHAVRGCTPIIARSFAELLQNIFVNRGGYPYWLAEGFLGLGDAYDRAT